MTNPDYEIEPEGDSFGQCNCCGCKTVKVWGWIHGPEGTEASYFVRWTQGAPDHGALFKLAIGAWGEGRTNEDRASIRLEYRITEDGGSFMVQDADDSIGEIAKTSLKRTDVIGTPLAPQCFAYVDAIWLNDARLDELASWS